MNRLDSNETGCDRDKRSAVVSVIIPVYNGGAYLDKCLESVRSQTVDVIEIICVDDGSTDGSGAIIDRHAREDARIVPIHQANRGVGCARNVGLAHSSGDYIAFVDSDDWVEPLFLEKMVKSLEKTGADVACCGYHREREARTAPTGPVPSSVIGSTAMKLALSEPWFFSSLWNKLFRREAVFLNGSPVEFGETFEIGEDEEWLSRVLPGCAVCAIVPEALYHWTNNEDSVTANKLLNSDKCLAEIHAKRAVFHNLSQYAELSPLAHKRYLAMLKAVFVSRYLDTVPPPRRTSMRSSSAKRRRPYGCAAAAPSGGYSARNTGSSSRLFDVARLVLS